MVENNDMSQLAALLSQRLGAKDKFDIMNMIDPRPIQVIDQIDQEKYKFD